MSAELTKYYRAIGVYDVNINSLPKKSLESLIDTINGKNVVISSDIYLPLAYHYDANAEYHLALKFYTLYIKTNKNGAVYNKIGTLYYKNGKYDDAKFFYSLGCDLGDISSICNMGNVYFREKNYEFAKKYYSIGANLGSHDAVSNLGKVYEKEGNFDMALKHYAAASEHGNLVAKKKLEILKSILKNFDY